MSSEPEPQSPGRWDWLIPGLPALAGIGWLCLLVGVISFGVGIAGGVMVSTAATLAWLKGRRGRAGADGA